MRLMDALMHPRVPLAACRTEVFSRGTNKHYITDDRQMGRSSDGV